MTAGLGAPPRTTKFAGVAVTHLLAAVPVVVARPGAGRTAGPGPAKVAVPDRARIAQPNTADVGKPAAVSAHALVVGLALCSHLSRREASNAGATGRHRGIRAAALLAVHRIGLGACDALTVRIADDAFGPVDTIWKADAFTRGSATANEGRR